MNCISGIEISLPLKNMKFKKMLIDLQIDKDLVDFIVKCLYLNPNKRISVEEALKHRFLSKKIN